GFLWVAARLRALHFPRPADGRRTHSQCERADYKAASRFRGNFVLVSDTDDYHATVCRGKAQRHDRASSDFPCRRPRDCPREMARRLAAVPVHTRSVCAQHRDAVFVGKARLEARGGSISWTDSAGCVPVGLWRLHLLADQQPDHRGRGHVFRKHHALYAELVHQFRGFALVQGPQLSLDHHAHGELQQRDHRNERRGVLHIVHFLCALPDFAPNGIAAVEIVRWFLPGSTRGKPSIPPLPSFTSSWCSLCSCLPTFLPTVTTSLTTPRPTSNSAC